MGSGLQILNSVGFLPENRQEFDNISYSILRKMSVIT